MKQQFFLVHYLLLALIFVVGSSNRTLLPLVYPAGSLLSNMWADPFCVLEQNPFGVERDENTHTALSLARAKSTTVINAHHWFPTLFPPPQTTPTNISPSSSYPSSSTSPLHVSSTSGSFPANSPAVLVEGSNDDDDASSSPSPNLFVIPCGSDNSIEEELGHEEITDAQPTEGQGHHMVTISKMGIHKPKTYPSEYQMFSAARDQAPYEP
ncbi:hypothetical protein Q3G72_000791 [Acer saccharum]|nr:hypothetical protein Q3G72_000791 [Acer saccharum]